MKTEVVSSHERIVSMPREQKPLPKWTIWIQKPHPLIGTSRRIESIEESLKSVYGLDCTYLGFLREYHQVQVYNGNKTMIQHAAQALLFLHRKWIQETINPPWNGVCDVTITVGSEQPAWVLVCEQERDRQFQERSEGGS
jgi:hypothetical protein